MPKIEPASETPPTAQRHKGGRPPKVPIQPPPTAKRWLSEEDVAVYTGISVSLLSKWRMDANGPPFSKIGKAVRYSVDDLEAWMRSHAVKMANQPERPPSDEAA